MTSPVPCPRCGKSLRVAADLPAGKAIKCPKCGHTFRPDRAAEPDDDDEPAVAPKKERPRKSAGGEKGRPKKPVKKSGSLVLPLAIGGGALLLLVVALGIAAAVVIPMLWPSRPATPPPGPVALNPLPVGPGPMNPPPKVDPQPPDKGGNPPKDQAGGEKPPPPKSPPPILGAWCLTEATIQGKPQKMLIDFERWRVFEPELVFSARNDVPGLADPFRYRHKADQGPRAIDFEYPTPNPQAGEPRDTWFPGIYEIQGERMRLCLAGYRAPRPTEFASPPGSPNSLYIYERVQGWKPGYTRKPIHVSKLERPDDGFKGDPNALAIDPAPPRTVPPAYDLSQGMVQAHSMPFKTGGLGACALDPTGSTIVLFHNGAIHFYDFVSRKLLTSVADPTVPYLFYFSPDGKRLLTLNPDKQVMRLRDVADGKELLTFAGCPRGGPTLTVTFTPGGRYVVAVADFEMLRIWDATTGKEVRRHEPTPRWHGVTVSPDGKYLLATHAKDMYLHDFVTLKLVRKFEADVGRYDTAVFSPDGKIIYAPWNRFIRAIDRDTGTVLTQYEPPIQPGRYLRVTPDHKYLVGTNLSGDAFALRVGEPKGTPLKVQLFANQFAHPGRAVMAQNGNEVLLFCAKNDPAYATPVSKFSAAPVTEAKVRYTLPVPGDAIFSFSPGGKFLMVARKDGKERSAHVFDAATGKKIKSIETTLIQILGVAISPDGGTAYISGVASTAPANLVKTAPFLIVDLKSGREERVAAPVPNIGTLWLSPDGGRLYATCGGYSFRAWDTKSRQQVYLRDRQFPPPRALEFLKGGKLMLMSLEDGPLLIDLTTARDLIKVPEGTPFMKLLGDGSRAALVNFNYTVKLWGLKDGKATPLKNFTVANKEDDFFVRVVGSSADGRLLYLAGKMVAGEVLHVWDVDAAKAVRRYRLPGGGTVVQMAPTGNTAVVARPDGLALIELPELGKAP